MSMTTHIHNAKKAEAKTVGSTSWVAFEDEATGNRVVIFCENFEVARATADAFNDAMAYSGADHEPA